MQASRIFTSNLKEKMAQRFFNLILLPRVRDDIDTYQKLNFHLYQALRYRYLSREIVVELTFPNPPNNPYSSWKFCIVSSV